MSVANVCDRCGEVIHYASDYNIDIYFHPYGETHYELCEKCGAELKKWLNKRSDNNAK